MRQKYTAIIRKSKLEYVAICLELNVSARGEDPKCGEESQIGN